MLRIYLLFFNSFYHEEVDTIFLTLFDDTYLTLRRLKPRDSEVLVRAQSVSVLPKPSDESVHHPSWDRPYRFSGWLTVSINHRLLMCPPDVLASFAWRQTSFYPLHSFVTEPYTIIKGRWTQTFYRLVLVYRSLVPECRMWRTSELTFIHV